MFTVDRDLSALSILWFTGNAEISQENSANEIAGKGLTIKEFVWAQLILSNFKLQSVVSLALPGHERPTLQSCDSREFITVLYYLSLTSRMVFKITLTLIVYFRAVNGSMLIKTVFVIIIHT